MVIKPQFEWQSMFKEGVVGYKTNNKYGLMDKKGNRITEPIYVLEPVFFEGLADVLFSDRKRGVIDKTGKVLYTADCDVIGLFKEGMAYVKKAGKYGFLNASCKLIVPYTYEDINIEGYSNGLIAVKNDGKWGFIDKTGTVVIPFLYDAAGIFSKTGYAEVVAGTQKFFINKSGLEYREK